jgi:hypothetical protein
VSGFVDFVLTVAGWLSLPLLGFSVWLLVRSVKRENRLRLRVLLIPFVTTVFVPVVYVAILGADPPKFVSGVLFLVGSALGVVWSNTTALTLRDGEVYGKRSVGYLYVWGATFIVSQVLALVATPEALRYGVSTLYLSLGITVTMNSALLYRRSRVKDGKPDEPVRLSTLLPQKQGAG